MLRIIFFLMMIFPFYGWSQSDSVSALDRITIIQYDTTKHSFPNKVWSEFVLDTTMFSDVELYQIDSIIQTCIDENKKKVDEQSIFGEQRIIGKYIGDHIFYKQIIPFRNKEGVKVVFINAICESLKKDDWKTRLTMIADGGDCHFQVYVNLSTKKYYDLYVGGI